jgi:esterase/lipase superfamily enzyme
VNREMTELWSAALGAAGTVIRYGHWGRPVLVFPSEEGRAWDFENNGMVGAVEGLLEAGRLKLYCVDSCDAASWSNREIPLEERARRHGRYESWIVGDVVPWIYRDCAGTPTRASGTNLTCGDTTSPMTGLPGASRWPITCRDSADDGSLH